MPQKVEPEAPVLVEDEKVMPDKPHATPNGKMRAEFLEGLSSALQTHPKDAELWYQVGQVFLGFGDFPTAAKCFRVALDLDPRLHKASISLSVAQDLTSEPLPRRISRRDLLDRVTPVLEAARRALESGEGDVPHVDWNLLRFRRIVERRLRDDPADLDALFLKASLDLKEGRHEDALRRVDAIIRQDERYPGVWFLKAEIFERLGSRTLASECRIKGHSFV
jgi:tetratricopeptide (TPR) repeat protein